MDEEEIKIRLQKSAEQQELYHKRVEAFRARADLRELSPREFGDAYADAKRPQNIEMLLSFEHMGWMVPRAERHARNRDAFRNFNFHLVPASGWTDFLFELDLIFVQFDVPDLRKGNADLRREVDAVVAKLEELRLKFYDLNHNIEFANAAMQSQAETHNHIPTIEALVSSHKVVSAWLAENTQPPRWRGKALREKRVELATKLMTIFHREFGLPPKPDGGSANVPLEDANEWQRFFQACAFIRLDERETPDRQAVLWEAYRNW